MLCQFWGCLAIKWGELIPRTLYKSKEIEHSSDNNATRYICTLLFFLSLHSMPYIYWSSNSYHGHSLAGAEDTCLPPGSCWCALAGEQIHQEKFQGCLPSKERTRSGSYLHKLQLCQVSAPDAINSGKAWLSQGGRGFCDCMKYCTVTSSLCSMHHPRPVCIP